MPSVVAGLWGALQLAGVPTDWGGMARGVASGIVGGVTGAMTVGVARGVVFGIAAGMARSVATILPPLFADADLPFGVAFGIAIGSARSLTQDTRQGLAFGVVLGTASGIDYGITRGSVGDAITGVLMIGIIFGMAVSLGHARAQGLPDGMRLGVSFGIVNLIFGTLLHDVSQGLLVGLLMWFAVLVFTIRLPTWLLESGASILLSGLALRLPHHIPTLARFLPFRWHDLIYLPLPGLQTFILTAAEQHPALARILINEASVYQAQSSIAAHASAELQARDLERAAQARLFAHAADFDLPFLPPIDTLSESSPLRFFQTAARDLDAGGVDQRQRRLALERARKTLEAFLTRTANSRHSDPLETRLLSTARVWLDVVHDEERRLAADEREHPQVPRAFIAGPPLSPDRPEDQPLFKGRTDIARRIAHDLDPDRRGVLIVIGQRRMGKSSFRNWLPRLLGTGTDVLVADFQALSGDPRRAHPHRWLVQLVREHCPEASTPPNTYAWGDALAWLRDIDASLGDRRLLVVVDEVERVEDGIRAGWCTPAVLDFLRAAGDSLRRIRFLLLTAHPLQRLGPHWVDRLISATERSISYLDEKDADDLVRAPIPDFPDIYPEGGIARILRETHRHPFLIQKTCDELCKYLNEHGGRRRATDDELTAVLDTVVEEKLFDELWTQRTEEEKTALQRLASEEEPVRADGAMRALSREGIVELSNDRARIAVPLFAAWVRLTQGTLGKLSAAERSTEPSPGATE